MSEFKEFDNALQEYKKLNIFIPDQELTETICEYVYQSNKLEGNLLSLQQTESIILQNKIEGTAYFNHVLEVRGNYKASKFIINASQNKYPLNEKLLKFTQSLVIGSLWKDDDTYKNWKDAGQELGEYKIKDNRIKATNENGEIDIITPLSDCNSVFENMKIIIDKYNESKAHPIQKSAYLAYNIFIHQPFPDGNKRTARLMASFTMMNSGMPFAPYGIQKDTNFNSALVKSYFLKDEKVFTNFLNKEFTLRLNHIISEHNRIKNQKTHRLGFII